MGTISIQRTICEALPQAMQFGEIDDTVTEPAGVYGLPVPNGVPKKGSALLCDVLQKNTTEVVTYELMDNHIRFAVRNRHTGQPATLFLALDGQLSEQGLAKYPLANVGQSAAMLLYNGLRGGAEDTPKSNQSIDKQLLAAATQYFTCLNRRGNARCAAPQHTITQLLHTKRAQQAQERQTAETQQVVALYDDTLQIWARVDRFIALAKSRGVPESDLGVVLELRQRWEPFRVAYRPSTLEAAQQYKQHSERAWSGFAGSKNFQDIVRAQGDCRKVSEGIEACGGEQKGRDTHGSTVCTLGEFTFSEPYRADECKEPGGKE